MSKTYDALCLQVRRSPWKLLGLSLFAFLLVAIMLVSIVFALSASTI
jgi:hypothetical protein